MDMNEEAIRDLQDRIYKLQSLLNEYNSMRTQINQVINSLNNAISGGEKACSMFERGYSESNTAMRKLEEMRDENKNILEIKRTLTYELEQINTRVRQITNDIYVMRKNLEALMVAK